MLTGVERLIDLTGVRTAGWTEVDEAGILEAVRKVDIAIPRIFRRPFRCCRAGGTDRAPGAHHRHSAALFRRKDVSWAVPGRRGPDRPPLRMVSVSEDRLAVRPDVYAHGSGALCWSR